MFRGSTRRITSSRTAVAAIVAAGSLLTFAGSVAADDTDDCGLDSRQRVVAHQLMERSERLLALSDVTVSQPEQAQAASGIARSLTPPKWLDDIFGTGGACAAAMDALGDRTADLAEASARYFACMGEKIAADFGGADHPGCDAEAGNMRSAAHDVDVAASNAEIACRTLFA